MKTQMTLTVEGPQGCGKTRFLRALQALLIANGVTLSFGREPDGHTVSVTIPDIDAFDRDAEFAEACMGDAEFAEACMGDAEFAEIKLLRADKFKGV